MIPTSVSSYLETMETLLAKESKNLEKINDLKVFDKNVEKWLVSRSSQAREKWSNAWESLRSEILTTLANGVEKSYLFHSFNILYATACAIKASFISETELYAEFEKTLSKLDDFESVSHENRVQWIVDFFNQGFFREYFWALQFKPEFDTNKTFYTRVCELKKVFDSAITFTVRNQHAKAIETLRQGWETFRTS